MAETLKKGSRVTGAARDKLAADLKKKYDSGASIRALAEETGRSYGFVHRMLSESGVTLRGRGGATRARRPPRPDWARFVGSIGSYGGHPVARAVDRVVTVQSLKRAALEPEAPMTSLDSVLVFDKDGVRLTVEDAVATVALTDPAKRNAQSPALWRALTEAGRSLPGSVRVVVLRGEGKSFSAGLDRQAFTPEGFDGEPSFLDMARGSDEDLDAVIAEYQDAFTWWRRSDIVSIAAVQGHAIGAGFQLALACDLRVVADDVQFAMRETSLDSSPTSPARTRSWGLSATPVRWRSAPRAASSTRRRPSASASPTSPCPLTNSTARYGT